MSHLHHFDNWGTVRFITFSCHRRLPLLADSSVAEKVLAQIDWARRTYDLRLFGYVIMPEHVHLVLWPASQTKMGDVIGVVKWRSAREIVLHFESTSPEILKKITIVKPGDDPGRSLTQKQATTVVTADVLDAVHSPNSLRVLGHPRGGEMEIPVAHRVWLPRCYDHNCRSKATVIEKINYCHWNSVKRGLVEAPSDWIWSSHRWYSDLPASLVEIDPLA